MNVEMDDTLPMDGGAEPIVDAPRLESEPNIPDAQAANGAERDEHGRFKAKGEKGENDGAPPASEPENVPVKALQEERRKRQEIEQKFAEIQQQLDQRNAAPPPDIFENTEGWQQQFGQQVTQSAAQAAAFNARLDTSEMLAATAHEDFEDMKSEFLRMVEENPTLRQQALADRHPWERAYQIARNAKTMQELGATSVEDLRAKIRAEMEAELRSSAPRFPTSTIQDGSVAGRRGAGFSGPTPDKDILPMG